MGYHFVIDEIETETSVKQGERLVVRLVIDNVGVAPIYHNLPLYIRLKNHNTEKIFKTDVDIRKWVEGKYEEELVLDVPKELEAAEYELQIGIGGGVEPSVVFASDAQQDGDYSVLGKISITI